MSTSGVDGVRLIRAWRRQRFSVALWLPVATTLTLASTFTLSLPGEWPIAVLRAGTAWLALGGMRLWDDLADLPADRVHHPDRVLTRASSTTHAWAAAVSSLYLAAGLVAPGQGRVVVFTGLVFALSVFYAANVHTRPVGPWLRLLKYPALVVALGGGVEARDLLALALVYVGVCHDELLQEQDASRTTRALLAASTASGVAAWAWLWWDGAVLGQALLATSAFMAAVLAWSLTMRGSGTPSRVVRACLLLGTMLLFALPQTVPVM